MRFIVPSFFLIFFIVQAQALTLKDIQYSPEKASALKKRRAALTSKSTHKKLSRAHTAFSKEKYSQALNILKKLEEKLKSRPFELAQVYQTLGFIYANQDKMTEALDYFEKSQALKTLPMSPTLSSMYTVAQINISLEKYKEGLDELVSWFHHVKKPNAQSYILAATALFELKKKKAALVFVNKAIKMTPKPPENWLQFSVALNYENKNYKEAASSLRILTESYPHKKKYWKQLTGVYLSLDKTRMALATIQMAHKMGHLMEEKELLNIISLQLSEGLPYKGAKFLDALMKESKVKESQKHFEVLAQAWIQSEELEKAVEPMRRAAELSDNGKTAINYGHILLELEKFESAEKAYSMSLKKGGLKHPGRVYLSRGITRFSLKNYKGSIQDFKKAMEEEKTKKAAQDWINYVELEQQYAKVL